jgi:hypothetical protein
MYLSPIVAQIEHLYQTVTSEFSGNEQRNMKIQTGSMVKV